MQCTRVVPASASQWKGIGDEERLEGGNWPEQYGIPMERLTLDWQYVWPVTTIVNHCTATNLSEGWEMTRYLLLEKLCYFVAEVTLHESK